MNFVLAHTKHATTKRRRVNTCVHNLCILNSFEYYQSNRCLSRFYLSYQPKSFPKRPFKRFLASSNCLTRADLTANLTGRATFLIQAKAAQDGPASFTGQVFDDKSKPLAGIKVSIGRTAMVSTTNDEGKFELTNIPPGRIDLFIDGRTYNPTQDAARAQYPSLHFEAYAVKGRVNQIAHPIYLPPLATSADSAKIVGGNQDVILTIPGLAGFKMKIKANSVTFPDGSKTGLLIVSPVTADKLPMAPPAGGATFGVPAWTIQPAGTRFDPPIEVSLPNAGGYPAGDNLPIVQWDHDLGQYVAMGRATVSEDGALLVTDSGSGLTKAGWGGLCRYDPDKCAETKPPELSSAKIMVEGWQDSDDVVEPVSQNVTFKAEAKYKNCSPKYEWDFDGVKKEGKSVTHIFNTPKKANVQLTVSCKADCDESTDPAKISKQRDVYAAKVTFEEAWSDQFPGAEATGWSESRGNLTGPVNKPYVLMGVRSDDAGYVRIKFKIEPQDQAVKDRIKFGLTSGAEVLGESGACPNASGNISGAEACLKIASPSLQDLHPAWGIDKNKDGKISTDERPQGATGEKFQWNFRIVSNSEYARSIAEYNSGVAVFGSIGQNWLSSFRDGMVPLGGIASPLQISRLQDGLTHAAGAEFAGAFPATGAARRVDYSPASLIVQEILSNSGFNTWVQDAIKSRKDDFLFEINSQPDGRAVREWTFSNVAGAGVIVRPKYTFVQASTGIADLYAAIGDSQSLSITLRVTVQKDIRLRPTPSIQATKVEIISGEIRDLFDWDGNPPKYPT